MLKLGNYLEACPAYRKAVAAQKAKDAERHRIAAEAAKARQAAARIQTQRNAAELARQRKEKAALVLKQARQVEQPEVEAIIEAVAHSHSLTVADIKGPSQFRDVVDARQEAIVLVRLNHPHLSMNFIGEYFGKDHSSVKNALKQAGVAPTKRRYIDHAEVQRLIFQDRTAKQIAEELGFSVETVLKSTFQLRNETVSPEKLEFLERAARLRENGFSYAKVAKILGINKSSLHRDMLKAGLAQ